MIYHFVQKDGASDNRERASTQLYSVQNEKTRCHLDFENAFQLCFVAGFQTRYILFAISIDSVCVYKQIKKVCDFSYLTSQDKRQQMRPGLKEIEWKRNGHTGLI
ncbi:hypothetical protein BpHYR1_020680 [Brachionus plicatilis]|uniref:Uncharacterized protein n=1 Tax=Brachionus plicatilis TaxID=10195 RepID=A0A3M7T7L3_BRAPC|nr:hypothetical protein BpHYR1_020680 [Brachionus plicatilis]